MESDNRCDGGCAEDDCGERENEPCSSVNNESEAGWYDVMHVHVLVFKCVYIRYECMMRSKWKWRAQEDFNLSPTLKVSS
jgi:hypothetical protein